MLQLALWLGAMLTTMLITCVFLGVLNNHVVNIKYDFYAPSILTMQILYLQEEMGWLYTLILEINIWYLCILKVIRGLFKHLMPDINVY